MRGRNGSGKTALLLTLAARMKQTEGTLNGRIRAAAPALEGGAARSLGLFSGLNDLQDSLTAAYALGAEFELQVKAAPRGGYGLPAAVAAGRRGERAREDLTSQKLAQLGIALAFVGEPDAVVVDDVRAS
ncbi:MAG: hypothetical protein ACLR3C_18430 [Eggerthella lenta]